MDFRHSPGNGIIPVYLKTRVLTISEFESNMIYNAELKDWYNDCKRMKECQIGMRWFFDMEEDRKLDKDFNFNFRLDQNPLSNLDINQK